MRNDLENSLQQDVDTEESFSSSPLHDACRKGNLNQVTDILSQGLVDINIRDEKHGRTPLMVAAHEGHCEIFEFLVSKGANKSDVDDDCKNVLHWACQGGLAGMVECVPPQYGIVKRLNESPLIQAAWNGYRDVFQFLVCTGSNVSQVDLCGSNVLHHACSGKHLTMVKYLVSLGIFDINRRNSIGVTPLMSAAVYGRKDTFDFLARMGAVVSHVENRGQNILHLASSWGRVGIVKYILSHNLVDINARDNGSKTAAMLAKYYREFNVYSLLVSRGCLVK